MLGKYIDLGNPVADHPLNRGLVTCWLPLLNNRGGSILFDLTRSGNHGTLTAGPLWTSCVENKASLTALSFDGSDDYVLGVSDPTAGGVAVSVAALVYPGTASFGGYVCSTDNRSSGYGWYLNQSGAGPDKWRFVKEVAFSQGLVDSDVSVVANAWQLPMGTCDAAGAIKIYVDGMQQSGSATQSGTMTVGQTVALRLSRRSDAAGFYSGRIACLWTWNRGLTQSEAYLFYEQTRRGWPDLLRRFSRRVSSFGSVAAADTLMPQICF